MRSVSAYSSIVNSARASYLQRESSSGANARVLRRYGNVLIVTCLCRFVCQTGFSYVVKRSFLHCGRASSAPPKSLSGSAVWAFPRGDTVFSAPYESAEEPFRALSPGRGGMIMPFSYVHRHPSVSVLRKSVVKIFYFLFA